jgi:[ribosomal protein S5]-alanine N-acetyltransferase
VRRSVRSTVAQHPGESAIQIRTNRLKIVPATVALARAELGDRLEFARQLDAAIPENWPPESAADALPLFLGWLEAAPDQVGWFGWYGLALEDTGSRILVAGGGFLGPPQAGSVQLGYSVLPQYQGRGYATELVNALIEWAREQPGLERIVAETEWANPASARVLQKAGFVEVGSIEGSEGSRFELRADKR